MMTSTSKEENYVAMCSFSDSDNDSLCSAVSSLTSASSSDEISTSNNITKKSTIRHRRKKEKELAAQGKVKKDKTYRVPSSKVSLFVDWLSDVQNTDGLSSYIFNCRAIELVQRCLLLNEESTIPIYFRIEKLLNGQEASAPEETDERGSSVHLMIPLVQKASMESIVWISPITPYDVCVQSPMKLNGILTRYIACAKCPPVTVELPDFVARNVTKKTVKALPVRDLILFGWDAFRGPMNTYSLPYAYNAVEQVRQKDDNDIDEIQTTSSRAYEHYKQVVYEQVMEKYSNDSTFERGNVIEAIAALLCARTIHALHNMEELNDKHRTVITEEFRRSIAQYYPRMFPRRPPLSEDAARGVLRYLDKIVVSSVRRLNRTSSDGKLMRRRKHLKDKKFQQSSSYSVKRLKFTDKETQTSSVLP